jgi:hypothetical protein
MVEVLWYMVCEKPSYSKTRALRVVWLLCYGVLEEAKCRPSTHFWLKCLTGRTSAGFVAGSCLANRRQRRMLRRRTPAF